jgi:hypothetical protein
MNSCVSGDEQEKQYQRGLKQAAGAIVAASSGGCAAVTVCKVDPLAECGGDQHQRIGDDKDPVSQEPAVEEKRGGCGYLSNEEPARQPG